MLPMTKRDAIIRIACTIAPKCMPPIETRGRMGDTVVLMEDIIRAADKELTPLLEEMGFTDSQEPGASPE